MKSYDSIITFYKLTNQKKIKLKYKKRNRQINADLYLSGINIAA